MKIPRTMNKIIRRKLLRKIIKIKPSSESSRAILTRLERLTIASPPVDINQRRQNILLFFFFKQICLDHQYLQRRQNETLTIKSINQRFIGDVCELSRVTTDVAKATRTVDVVPVFVHRTNVVHVPV